MTTSKDDAEIKEDAIEAACEHLAAIGWDPDQGLSSQALGLGGDEEWGGCPEGVEQLAWSDLCRAAVRVEARRRTRE